MSKSLRLSVGNIIRIKFMPKMKRFFLLVVSEAFGILEYENLGSNPVFLLLYSVFHRYYGPRIVKTVNKKGPPLPDLN